MKHIISLLFSILFLQVSGAEYNILHYGAVNNKNVISTVSIQKAIDACSVAGGGTVLVPAGEYSSGPVYLKSNICLYLDNGATIYASTDTSDYKGLDIPNGASDARNTNLLIGASGCRNISVKGKGRLHGQAVREPYTREAAFDPNELITGREIANAAKYGADYRSKYRRVQPSPGLINFTGCRDVTIEGIQLVESSFWTLHLQWCNHVFVKGIYITSDPNNGVNSDGLDIDGCQQVVISDCMIDTGDDALCLKTTRNNGKSMPCEDITITNCILRSSSAALKIGTESHSDFRRITVSNCVINGANRGLNMIIRDGGHVSDVKFSGIIIHTVRKACFWWGNGDPIWLIVANRTPSSPTGSIRNVTFDNITAHGQSGIRLEGFNSALENIRFNNIQLTMEHEDAIDKRSRHGFHFMNVKNLSLTECEIHWDEQRPEKTWEHAFNFENIENLYLDKLKGKPAPQSKMKALNFEHISGDFIKSNLFINK